MCYKYLLSFLGGEYHIASEQILSALNMPAITLFALLTYN